MDKIQKIINEYGKKIDDYDIEQNAASIKDILSEMELFADANIEVKEDINFNYYLGTGYGEYADALIVSGLCRSNEYVVSARSTSMYYLRKAYMLYNPSTHNDPRIKLRVLTNYANNMDSVGRVFEALRVYREVIEDNDRFSIAWGNYGLALSFLANIVNDAYQRINLHCHAYNALKKATEIPDIDNHKMATSMFQGQIDKYDEQFQFINTAQQSIYNEYSMGDTEEERAYKGWCLKMHLFLNPLNEVMELESAYAHDSLIITSYTESLKDNVENKINDSPPKWFAMINQLKEEYIYARFLVFEGLEKSEDVHYADKNVELSLSSFDYCNYSIRIEQLKSAYKTLYSIFDQICFFVNSFWKLGLSERYADAHHVYKSKKYPKENVALASLRWVLREFYEEYGDADEGYEKHLYILRNALEHKYVKVHEYSWKDKLQLEDDGFYHVSEKDLKKYTKRLLQLSKESLMYLVYAIGIEEGKKGTTGEGKSVNLAVFPDEWKR